jgi:hypothetical protein
MNAQASLSSDSAVLVNISTQVWPPRHRTYLGSLVVRSHWRSLRRHASTGLQRRHGPRRQAHHGVFHHSARRRRYRPRTQQRFRRRQLLRRFCRCRLRTHRSRARRCAPPPQRFLHQARYLSRPRRERSYNPMFITDLDRRSARERKPDKPWLYDPKPSQECPACAEKIKLGVAVCRSCGAIEAAATPPRRVYPQLRGKPAFST